jgi:hypothetical protein
MRELQRETSKKNSTNNEIRMSIPTTSKQTKLTNQLMENIRDLLNSYFIEMDMVTVPILSATPIINKNEMGIKEIIEVVNTTVDKKVYPLGLNTKIRRRDLVIKRQIVSYVCRAAGFQFHYIARALDVNHATVIHGVNSVKNLIETKEHEFMQIYEDTMAILNTYHREKYGKDLPQID